MTMLPNKPHEPAQNAWVSHDDYAEDHGPLKDTETPPKERNVRMRETTITFTCLVFFSIGFLLVHSLLAFTCRLIHRIEFVCYFIVKKST